MRKPTILFVPNLGIDSLFVEEIHTLFINDSISTSGVLYIIQKYLQKAKEEGQPSSGTTAEG